MSYAFLIGAATFVTCWFVGWLLMDFTIDRLPKTDRKRLLNEVKIRDIRFSSSYVLVFLVAFAIFEIFPTLLGIKLACAVAFFIFIVGTGYGVLVRIRKLFLPRDLFDSALIGFLLIVVGYLVFVFMIRGTLAIRIWH